jgi:succinate dehydrogenase / fumarate reductase membrane anchor subunit
MKETKKWISHRISAAIVAPLFFWLYFSLISLSTKNYHEAVYFFENPLIRFLAISLFFVGFFHANISLNEIFDDYIHNKKIKDVANILTLIFSIIIPIIILILLI